jgi:beta-N-acetylhexosaminidase
LALVAACRLAKVAAMRIKSFIAGCSALQLTAEETGFFREENPWGLILFARNISSPQQVTELTGRFRECVGREDAPVLIDQEGGRVQRLRPPHWRQYPAAREIGALYARDRKSGLRAAWLQSRLIAFDLTKIGINVDCLPVLDVPVADASDVIGDRAYSVHPHEVEHLGRKACEGLIAGGVLPVIKHIPGHGRARVDSHQYLPQVDTHPAILGCTDLYPFMQLADMPIAMTAHVVYSGFDPVNPATTSRTIVNQVVRGWLGFDGLLISDDLSMNALSGDLPERAKAALAAGCDIVMHCNGDMAEMEAVAREAPELGDASGRRAAAALELIAGNGLAMDDEASLRAEFDDLLAVAA